MTPEQRERAFQDEMQAAAQRYGVQVEAVSVAEQLGPVIQVRGQIVIRAIPNWLPPNREPEHTNGKVKEKA